MPYLKIVILEKDKTDVAFPEVNPKNFAGELQLTGASILEGGMESGSTSVGFLLEGPDGKHYFAQQSAEIIMMLAHAIQGAEVRFATNKAKKN